jgi:hypothetical protein
MSTTSPKQAKPLETTSPSWSIYRNITELPLSRFIDLTVDGYLRAIVKEGNPPEIELKKAESVIRIQYADASGDHQYKMYCTLLKEITDLEITLLEIHSLVNTLKEVYHPFLAKALNELLRSNLVFDVMNPEEYDRNLIRAINRSKGIKINIDLKTIAFKAVETKYTESGGKATREYYMGILITLSEAYPLSDNITVWEFCERIKRFNKKHEAVNVKKHG